MEKADLRSVVPIMKEERGPFGSERKVKDNVRSRR
jgi:hypothetical protein